MSINSFDTPARSFAKGIGQAVADRTVARVKSDGNRETWADVALRVAFGNSMLHPANAGHEFSKLHHHLRQASVLMSGRHLQHGDHTQPTRNQEVFTNCSTAASSFILFYLLLNGSGVGRCYDDDMMLVDWAKNMPNVVVYADNNHADVISGEIPLEASFQNWNHEHPDNVVHYEVPDSREGWAKAVEQIERLTFEGVHAHKTLVLDFSAVRPRGAPIGGMQDRPASGPGPLMKAIENIAKLKGNDMAPWLSTLWVDHYLAECVLVGGARRAARMSTKTWRDKSVLEFVSVKQGGSVLWSSNNSVTVDKDFWAFNQPEALNEAVTYEQRDLWLHATSVFEAACVASYHDGTGEPGFINVDMLEQKDEGIEVLFDGRYAESDRFKLDEASFAMTAALAKAFAGKPYKMITNPCGEISLGLLGGYCVIADVVPYHSRPAEGPRWRSTKQYNKAWDDDAEDAFRTATRALIRTNLMNCVYGKEVKRTNRIGVGITGLHEYAWERFGLAWADLVDRKKSLAFWQMLARFSNAVVDEARRYSAELGVPMPHTALTMKPAGTTSKLFGLTEGAHLPSMAEYIRWVQFRYDDPLIEQYRAKGYPVRELKTYSGTTIVGFPTVPEICKLGMGDKLVTAAQATPEEQYEFLRLLESYWLHGRETVPGVGIVSHDFGNQVSYTLKYDPSVISYEEFRRTLLNGQSSIKCCSVMPQIDTTAYEYQPEQPVTREEFEAVLSAIDDEAMKEEIGFEHVSCAGGACPIDWAHR